MPPAVGYADTSSDMHRPMIRMNIEISGQPSEIAIGPPLFQACPKVVKQPDRIEMIENEIAKFENPLHLRLSSCLYPSSARRFSSASWIAVTVCDCVATSLPPFRVIAQIAPDGASGHGVEQATELG